MAGLTQCRRRRQNRQTADLIYTGIASLDGYVADSHGNFDWSAPDEEVHAFVNDTERGAGTFLLGRRMYEVMAVWETLGGPADPPVIQDYGRIWRAADKIVFSGSLQEPQTPRTTVQRSFDPTAVRELKERTEASIGIGGATLAAAALQAGLVDECRIFLNPVAVGGGLRFLPDDLNLSLELMEDRRFRNGVMYLRYRVRS